MWAVRKHFPDAHLTLLCDRHPGKARVLAADLLRGTQLFDEILSYIVDPSALGYALRPVHMVRLLVQLRRSRYDTLVYLAPSTRSPEQVTRDRKFFVAVGIKEFVGMSGFPELPVKIPGRPLGTTRSEADLLLSRLAADGIKAPPQREGSLELNIRGTEEAEVNAWLTRLPSDEARSWIGIGPGSKMPAKRWPEERYQAVVAHLIRELHVWPVVFGGTEDKQAADRLLKSWGCGYSAAGAFSLRGTAAALRHCKLYLGNDTGTMHLAAAAGIPCVALFSSREWPGMWFPYGVEQKVFRSQIECEGCGLFECVEKHNECLNRISVGEVFSACANQLRGVCATVCE